MCKQGRLTDSLIENIVKNNAKGAKSDTKN